MVSQSAVVNNVVEFDHGIVRRTQLSELLAGITWRSERRHQVAMGLVPAEWRRTAVGKIVETSRGFTIRLRNRNVVDREIGPGYEAAIDCRGSCGIPDAGKGGIVVVRGRMKIGEVAELILPRPLGVERSGPFFEYLTRF